MDPGSEAIEDDEIVYRRIPESRWDDVTDKPMALGFRRVRDMRVNAARGAAGDRRRGAHQPALRQEVLDHVVNEEGESDKQTVTYNRPDFWTTTSNKQLNFVQHVRSLMKIGGRAAVVVPDNVLFEGGAGETVRRKLLAECDVHTLLRLPTGIFYAQGVKANVLFFERKPGAATPWTKTVWVYDLRTNQHFTLKQNRLARADLDDFVACFRPGARHDRAPTWSEGSPAGRFRPYGYDEIVARDKCSLDLFWLRDESLEDSASFPEPHVIAQEIADDLRSALEEIEDVLGDLQQRAAKASER
jgi:type I restriction enzyme M protein